MAVIHPFLIAVIPILHIVAGNPGQVRLADALLPVLVSLGFTVVAFAITRLVLKDREAAGLVVSLFLVLFFSTGHFVDFVLKHLSAKSPWHLLIAAVCVIALADVLALWKLRDRLRGATWRTYTSGVTLSVAGVVCLLLVASLAIAFPRYALVTALCAILAVGTFAIVRSKGRLRNPTRVLNVVAMTLLALVLVNLFTGGPGKDVSMKADEVRSAAESGRPAPPDSAALPDIYYIILDEYGSERFLRDHYSYDNGEFIGWLESRGFYVAADSKSNYNHTELSLASSLNLKYVNYLSGELGERSRYMAPLWRMIEDNSLMRFLKSRGYKFAFFGTGYSVTRSNRYADVSRVECRLRTEFITTLLNSTTLRCFKPSHVTRKSVLATFAEIPRVRKNIEGPMFLFAHVLPPHPPYLFDRNGGPSKQGDDMKAMYLEQLRFVNKKVKQMVDGIISVSDRPPVIVIQGDHGPFLDEKDPVFYTTENLNALLVPGPDDIFYSSITPVNSFRLILDRLFGTRFGRLEDRVFVSHHQTPYSFKEEGAGQ